LPPSACNIIKLGGNVKEIMVKNCPNYSEEHLVGFATAEPKIEMFRAINCTKMSFRNALQIVSNLPHLKFFAVDPRYPQDEEQDWMKLMSDYPQVDFIVNL